MHLRFCSVGSLQENCYMLSDDDTCILIDPGDEPQTILGMLGGRKPDLIIITHHHLDHIGALAKIVEATGAPVACYVDEAPKILNPEPADQAQRQGISGVEKIDKLLEDGEVFTVGNVSLKAIHTPGHTEGGMCIFDEADGALFSGDTLFYRTHGRTDFPGGDAKKMEESLLKLSELPADTMVFPGHGQGTTIGDENIWIKRL